MEKAQIRETGSLRLLALISSLCSQALNKLEDMTEAEATGQLAGMATGQPTQTRIDTAETANG